MNIHYLGKLLALVSLVAVIAVAAVACDRVQAQSELLGPPGPEGDVGPKGETGAIGPKGETGAVAPKGGTGATGATGPRGPRGQQGDGGPPSADGPQGPQGLVGPRGPAGNLADQSCPPGEFFTGITGGVLVCSALPGIPAWYADTDGDGFGDPAESVVSVSRPAGFVSAYTDCDDTDADVNPNAPDPPGDGIDQNCDGRDTPIEIVGPEPNNEFAEATDMGFMSPSRTPGRSLFGNIHNELDRDVYRFQLRDDETLCLQNEAQSYYWRFNFISNPREQFAIFAFNELGVPIGNTYGSGSSRVDGTFEGVCSLAESLTVFIQVERRAGYPLRADLYAISGTWGWK